MDLHKRTTKRLSILWLVTFVIYCVLVRLINDLSTDAPNAFHHIAMIVVLLYFCPLLFCIQRSAKLAEMKKTMVTARFLLVHHIAWFCLGVLEWEVDVF